MAWPSGNIYYATGNASTNVATGSEGNQTLEGTEPGASTLGATIGGGQAGVFWTFTSEPNDPNLTTWEAGDYIAQVNVSLLGADVDWGIQIHRVNSTGASVEVLATGTQNDYTAAGVQTLTWNNPSDKTVNAGDRLQVAVIGVRLANHGNEDCSIDVGTGVAGTTTKLTVPGSGGAGGTTTFFINWSGDDE